MASFDKEHEAVKAALRSPDSEESIEVLQRVLQSKHAYLVSIIAPRAAEIAPSKLIPLLAPAFSRFMGKKAARKDPQCKAKTAIAQALATLGRPEEDLFLDGVKHVQMEPVYGGRQDTAAELRAACAIGLAASGYPDVMVVLADLLADGEEVARRGAARAVSYAGRLDAVPLLRLKANLGDQSADVMGECFASLLALEPDESVEFVGRFLRDDSEPIQEAAALSLGESRTDGAFEVLRDWLDGSSLSNAVRSVGWISMALLRTDQAWEHMFHAIENGMHEDGELAIRALSSFKHDPDLVARVRDAAGLQHEDAVNKHFA